MSIGEEILLAGVLSALVISLLALFGRPIIGRGNQSMRETITSLRAENIALGNEVNFLKTQRQMLLGDKEFWVEKCRKLMEDTRRSG